MEADSQAVIIEFYNGFPRWTSLPASTSYKYQLFHWLTFIMNFLPVLLK